MKKPTKKLIFKLIEYSLYIWVVYFIYQKLAPNLDKIELSKIDLKYIVIAVIIYSFHGIWNGWIWNFIVKASGEKTDIWAQISVYLRSYLLRYVPGNVVGILSRGLLNIENGIPMLKSVWGWFFENILYLGVSIILGFLALKDLQIDTKLIYLAIFGALAAGIFIIIKHDLLESLFHKIVKPRVPKKYQNDIVSLSLDLKERTSVAIFYSISWLIYSMSFLFIVASTGFNITGNIVTLIAINAASYAIGYLSLVTPSGVGVREAVMIYLLGTLLAVEPQTSVIIAVLARIIFIVGELAGILVFYIVKFIKDAYKRTN